jgi:hypothetical protein
MDGTTAAPATPSGSTTTGPTSFSDTSLTWSGDSSTPTPSTESTPPASASADTTVPPAAAPPADGVTQQQGEPPQERWADILANARTKAAEEALAPYAWAKQVQPQEFQQIQRIAAHFAQGDTMGGLKALLAEARKDPQVDAQLRSEAARILSQRQQPSPTAPQMVNVQLEDGSVVPMPRDPEAWLAHQKQQWTAEIEQKFQPVTKTIEQLHADRAAAVQQQQVEQFTAKTYQDMATWPGMDSAENQKAVATAMGQMGLPDDASPDQVLLAAERAWRTHIAPQLSNRAQAQLLDSLKTKAAASSSVNPGSAAPSAPRTVSRFDQLPPDAWR